MIDAVLNNLNYSVKTSSETIPSIIHDKSCDVIVFPGLACGGYILVFRLRNSNTVQNLHSRRIKNSKLEKRIIGIKLKTRNTKNSTRNEIVIIFKLEMGFNYK